MLLVLLGVSLRSLLDALSSSSSRTNGDNHRSSPTPVSAPKIKNVELNTLQLVTHSFSGYATVAREFNARRRSKYQQLSLAHTLVGERINYTQKLLDVERAIDATGHFANQVVQSIKTTHPDIKLDFDVTDPNTPLDYELVSHFKSTNFKIVNVIDFFFGAAQVQTELQHIVRDWSTEGESERLKLFDPIFKALRHEFPSGAAGKNVLVPGAGLGRLAHELSNQDGMKRHSI